QRLRLMNHIASRRILLGPWWVQNDEFLSSGESTIRNLLIGTRLAHAYGANERDFIGYVPDQFGHIGQLPQILRGFGMTRALLGRGVLRHRNRDAAFRWVSPDGSSVNTVLMIDWYNNAQRFPGDPDRSEKLLHQIVKQLSPVTPSGQLLLMNGVDHLEAQENLSVILKMLNRRWSDGRVVHSNFTNFFNALEKSTKKWRKEIGELRAGDDGNIINGTLSTRPYLKRVNDETAQFLERYVEPIAVLTSLARLAPYPAGELRYAWKQLMLNQAHDSICGCSVDAVHEDNVARFRHVNQIGRAIFEDRLDDLAHCLVPVHTPGEDDLILVFNPCPYERTGIMEARIDILEDEPPGFVIETFHGEPVPMSPLGSYEIFKQYLDPINLPGLRKARRWHVSLAVEKVPALGWTALRLIHTDAQPVSQTEVEVNPRASAPRRLLENEMLRVTLNKEGALDVESKVTGAKWRNMLIFEDRGERGDQYIHVPPKKDSAISTRGKRPEILWCEDHALGQSVALEWTLSIPEGLSPNYRSRSRRKAPMTLEVVLTLRLGEPFVRVQLTVDNPARQHCLRALFPLEKAATNLYADAPFEILRRSEKVPKDWNLKVLLSPMDSFVSTGFGKGDFALFSKGVRSYQTRREPEPALALMIFRATESIYPPDPVYSIPEQVTAQAELPGVSDYSFAIYFPAPPFGQEALLRALEIYRLAFATWQVPCDPRRAHGGRPFVQDSAIQEYALRPRPGDHLRLPGYYRGPEIESPLVRLSAWKKAEDRDTSILRFYNTSSHKLKTRITLPAGVRRVWRTNLNERREAKMTIRKNQVAVSLNPHQIVSLELEG
ncbi:MAG: glycoside hydrolase family 38 C-terminal domain-containing protein, partial [bacterium]